MLPMSNDLASYHRLGDPLTLPAGAKYPPPKGTTGRDPAVVMSWQDVEAHVADGGNWAIRVSPRLIVIDIDAHKGSARKAEAERMMAMHQLPPTLQVTSRYDSEPLSGHYYYRLPKDHDWTSSGFVSSIRSHEVHWGETVHQHHRYAVMPGSVVDGRIYRAIWHGGSDVIADLPSSMYHELLRGSYQPAKPAGSDGSWSTRQIDLMRQQSSLSLGSFRLAREGRRDDTAMRAARDIGALWRMTGDVQAKDDQLARLLRYAQDNGSDADTVAKFESQIADGYASPTLLADDGEDDWWHDGGHLERCYNRAMLRGDSPMATLLIELTYLSAATDHRVVLEPVTDDIPRPCALWVGIVADSGRHKSRVLARVQEDYADLPQLPKPPKPLRAAREGEPDHAIWPPDLIDLPRAATPRVFTPQTGPGVAAEFMRSHKFAKSTQEIKLYYRTLAHYDEPDDIFRKTNTEHRLTTVLRSTFYSGLINPGTAKKDGRYYLHAGSYVVSLIVNIQPYIMSRFRDLRQDGTFQRLIFADTSIDPDVAAAMAEDPDKYASEISDIAPWRPGAVTLDDEAKAELRAMEWWHLGLDRAEHSQWSASWARMAARGSSDAGHLDVKLQRLAVMLYRHDGGKLTGKRTVISSDYFTKAKKIMADSASVVRNTIIADAELAAKDEARQLDKTAKRARASEQGKQAARANVDLERLLAKHDKFGGKSGAWQRWRKLDSGKVLGREQCKKLWLQQGGQP